MISKVAIFLSNMLKVICSHLRNITKMSERNLRDMEEEKEEKVKKYEEEYQKALSEIRKSNAKSIEEYKKTSNKPKRNINCRKWGGHFVPLKQGYGFGKATVGLIVAGPIGLLAGGINKNKIELVCSSDGVKK